MSVSKNEVLNALYNFHATQYGFASGIIGTGADVSEAINNPSFNSILQATASLVSAIGGLATLTMTSNNKIDKISLAADATSLYNNYSEIKNLYDNRHNPNAKALELKKVTDLIGDTYMLAGDAIRNPKLAALLKATGMSIKTYGLVNLGNDKMHPSEFFNSDNWEGFLGELLEDFSKEIYGWLPDAFNPWKDANREGKHYFYDPLVLDLDGDGIETIKLNSQDANVNAYFDFDGDGLAHATGWIKKDDGMLVRDINGDGVINNGTEVFGDSTIKRDGTTAKHGFDALVDLDDNGDGLINADDSAFGTLKIWRDMNADGISQADELFSLNTLGITSLNANYEDTNRVIAGGKLAQLGSYSKGDKTYAMGDVDFSFSGVHSRYQDRISLNDTVRALPILAGVGRLRDLRKIRE